MRLALALVLAGCGRLAFDPQPVGSTDAAPSGDGRGADAASVPAGPTLWLRCDSGPSGGILDSAGTHVIACGSTGCPVASAGLHAGGYGFTNQELDVAYAADLDATTGFTAAYWVKLAALPAIESACPFNMPFDDAQGFDTFALCIDVDGTVVYDSESPSGTADGFRGAAIAAGAWHHLAETWDGTTKRGYIDGVQDVAHAIQIGHGTQDPTVGGSRGAFFVQGTLDDVIYYPRALAAAEVAQLASP